jgi:predicted RNA-binding Zn ribbon-like protein
VSTESEAAPGRLESLRLLVNTLSLPKGPDALGGVAAASEWCREHGFSAIAGERELARLVAFREAARELLYANNGESDPRAAWTAMRAATPHVRLEVRIDPEHGPKLEAADDGVDRLIGTMLAVVYDAVADGTWPRLRACKRSDCRWAYYDSSKNGSRAWCSMAVCGNREKAQRRRAREHS